MGGAFRLTGRWRAALAAVLAVAGPLWFAGPVGASGAASTFTVTGFADGTGSCASTPDANGNVACTTLRAAVNRANLQANSPTIELQAGTFTLNDPAGQLDLATSMNIVGAGPGGPGGTTIQQADGRSRVLQIDGVSILSGLEITGGHNSPAWSSGQVVYGGGILVEGALTLQNALVTGNRAIGASGTSGGQAGDPADGGGIYYGAGATTSVINDSTVSGNSAIGGVGGVSGSPGGAASGGGISYDGPGAPLSVQNSTVSGNTATGGHGGGNAGGAGGAGGAADGGGIANTGTVIVTATTIAGNAANGGSQGASAGSGGNGGAAEGGGIFNSAGTDQLVNSTIFGNTVQGGAASLGGTASGLGGGIGLSGVSRGLTLQSDTIDANSASSADGNLHSAAGASPASIHDTVLTSGSPNSCGGASPPSSESYNLEDDSADTCGFTPANHDLVGANPQLPTGLANYGGPTQTLAPAPGSPLLGAGGACLDPTSAPPNQPLVVDQRGEPRTTPCDIGAFQGQRPANTARPAVSGNVARGQTLVCSQGTWTGDGQLAYAFAWLRNGVVIPGTSTNTYVVGAADGGQTLACEVTATYYGSSSAASPFVIVPSYPVITVLSVSTSPTEMTLSLGCRGLDGQRCRGQLTVTVVEKRLGGTVVGFATRAGKQVAAIGTHGYSIRARHTATIHIALAHKVARWLKRFKKVPALLTVSQTTAGGTGTVASLHLKIHRPKGNRHG